MMPRVGGGSKRHREHAKRYQETVRTIFPKCSASQFDVIQAVNEFNTRLAEYADQAARDIKFGKFEPPSESRRAIETSVGPKIVLGILASTARGGDELVAVQFALQAVFTRVATSVIQSWSSDAKQIDLLYPTHDGVISTGTLDHSIVQSVY